MKAVPYALAIGSLMYVMVCMSLDIAHAVGVVSRFLTNPEKDHRASVKWIMRYLREMTKASLCLSAGLHEFMC